MSVVAGYDLSTQIPRWPQAPALRTRAWWIANLWGHPRCRQPEVNNSELAALKWPVVCSLSLLRRGGGKKGGTKDKHSFSIRPHPQLPISDCITHQRPGNRRERATSSHTAGVLWSTTSTLWNFTLEKWLSSALAQPAWFDNSGPLNREHRGERPGHGGEKLEMDNLPPRGWQRSDWSPGTGRMSQDENGPWKQVRFSIRLHHGISSCSRFSFHSHTLVALTRWSGIMIITNYRWMGNPDGGAPGLRLKL